MSRFTQRREHPKGNALLVKYEKDQSLSALHRIIWVQESNVLFALDAVTR